MDFFLDSRLENDSFKVIQLKCSECRLMNNKNFLWLILIPRRHDKKDWIDLIEEDQIELLKEINQCGRVLKNFNHPIFLPCEKLNIASLGNVVSQLHIHIISRNSKDIAWPKPVWGVGADFFYTQEEKENIVMALQAAF